MMVQGVFDIAQICLSGHVINSRSTRFPALNQDFCARCGKPAISKCDMCDASIRGAVNSTNVTMGFTPFHPPLFCPNCGEPYPWTKSRLQAAQELADETDALSDEEKVLLKESLDDIVGDTPQTTVAATRFKKLMAKAGIGVADGFKNIIVDIASETAKKLIWP